MVLYNYSNMFGVFAVKYVNSQDNTWYQGVCIFLFVVGGFFSFLIKAILSSQCRLETI